MTTDANVVATLNPGLSMRNLDDGIVVAARQPRRHAQRHHRAMGDALGRVARQLARPDVGPDSRASGERAGRRAGSKPTGAQFPRAARQSPAASSRTGSARQSVARRRGRPDVKKRGGMAVFGWMMLVLIIVGGVGAAART